MTSEFVFLANTLLSYPSETVTTINGYENNVLIISSCGKYMIQKCPNAIIMIRDCNDEKIFQTISKTNFKMVVIDNCFYDKIDKDSFLQKIKLLQNTCQFNLLVISQLAGYFMYKLDVLKATRILVPDYTERTIFNDLSHILVKYDKNSFLFYDFSKEEKIKYDELETTYQTTKTF